MKKEEKEKFEIEINEINQTISNKETEIMHSHAYKNIEKSISELKEGKNGDTIKYQEFKKEIYGKYTIDSWWVYYGLKLSNIKSSVKQGIKVGLGMKNVKSIEDNILNIVRELINKELENPKIEELKQKILKVDDEMKKLRNNKNKLIDNGLIKLREKRDKVIKEFEKKKNTKVKDKKLEKQKKEAEEKVINLPNYLSKITQEVNKRLILDGIKK